MRDVRIIADRENNALLILSTSGEYGAIESALRKLDIPARQVLIDVTIAEVTLSDELSVGVEWIFNRGGRRTAMLDTGGSGIAPLTPGFSWVLRDATGTDIRAVLNLLAADRRVNVLSSPHVMVADNHQARIQIGDSVPIAGPQSILGGGIVVNSTQYLDTGIILTVTPRISAGGLVTLDVQQEVSNALTTTTSGLNSPTISRRAARSLVTVRSGDTTVLGGLIQENRTTQSSGIPFLSKIPVIGALFGTQDYTKRKTELVVLITPRIAPNVGQAKAVSDEFRRRLGSIEEMLEEQRRREAEKGREPG